MTKRHFSYSLTKNVISAILQLYLLLYLHLKEQYSSNCKKCMHTSLLFFRLCQHDEQHLQLFSFVLQLWEAIIPSYPTIRQLPLWLKSTHGMKGNLWEVHVVVFETAFATLETQDKQLAQEIHAVWQEAKGLGANEGAKRLEIVAQHFNALSLEEAYKIIDLDAFIKEIERVYISTNKLKLAYTVRNGWAILPLTFTWFTLSDASSRYQQDVTNPKYPNDIYLPFLKLWQDGFHGTTVFTFSNAAFIDGILLSIYLLLIIGLPIYEQRKLDQGKRFVQRLQDVTKHIADFIAAKGTPSLLPDKDLTKMAELISDAIKSSIDRALYGGRKVAEESEKFVRETSTLVKTLLNEFQGDLVTFSTDVGMLTADLHTLQGSVQSQDVRLQELTEASNDLATSSKALVTNAQKMSESADGVTHATQHIASNTSSISDHLSDLKTTQLQMVTTISSTQQQLIHDFENTQHTVAQELDNTQQQVVTAIISTQKQMIQEVGTTQQTVVQELGDTQTRFIQSMENTQNQIVGEMALTQQHFVQGITSAQQTLIGSIQDTADMMGDVAKDTKAVAKNLGQITQTDIQQLTKDIAGAIATLNASTQSDIKRINDQVAQDMKDISDEVRQMMSNMRQVNQQLEQTIIALGQASQSLNTGGGFTQMSNDLRATTKVLGELTKTLQRRPRLWPF